MLCDLNQFTSFYPAENCARLLTQFANSDFVRLAIVTGRFRLAHVKKLTQLPFVLKIHLPVLTTPLNSQMTSKLKHD